jgi:prevent-host-death family protein
VQDAKARFSALLDTCLAEGPQTITRRGTATAVLVSLADWRKTHPEATLKDLLLAQEARHELDLPDRRDYQSRPVGGW